MVFLYLLLNLVKTFFFWILQDDIDILIIILGVIVAIFGVAQMAHTMDQAWNIFKIG